MTPASLLVSPLIASKPRAARRPTCQALKKSPLADCLMCACRIAGRLSTPRLDTFAWFAATRLAVALAALTCIALSLPTSHSQAAEPRTVTNSIGMKLVLIPKGQFTMGSPVEEEGSEDDETPHVVTLTADYYLGVTEVTQEQFRRVMGRNPSGYQGEKAAERNPRTGRVLRLIDTANYPVENVTWPEAVEFCRKLSAIPAEQQASRVYRLPTEAEWEYACRAGSKSAYSFGPSLEKLAEHAWFEKNAKSPQPVGMRKPNSWGLYDMHGNVWEWCADWMGDYTPTPATAPTGPQQGTDRVVRGGGWDIDADACRSAYRDGGEPTTRIESLGFRVALTK